MTHSQTSRESGISRAIRIAGGQVALAKLLNAGKCGTKAHVSQQSVSLWSRQGFVPWLRAIEISTCLKGRVPPGDLVDPAVREMFNTTCFPPARLPDCAPPDVGASEVSCLVLCSLEAHDGQ